MNVRKRGNEMKYLVVECIEVFDEWEKTPICVTEDYSEYDKYGYEIYEIYDDGSLELIRKCTTITSEGMYVCIWKNSKTIDMEDPNTIVKVDSGNRYDVTKSTVKKIKAEYGFTDSIKEIYNHIQCFGYHGEKKNKKWVVYGEGYDNCYPRGF